MKLSKNAKRMLLLISAASLLFIVIGMVAGAICHIPDLMFPFALGVAMIGAVNCLKIVMLERAVLKAIDMSEGAKGYIGGQYLLRFLLTGVVLVVAATQDFVSLWGAVAGIFTLPIAAFGLKFFIARDEKTGNYD